MALSNASGQRTPTPAQIKQERALALVIGLDLALIVPYLLVAIAVESLSMIAEVLRGGLLLLVIGASLRTLRRTHRGLTGDYDYGMCLALLGRRAAVCSAASPQAETGEQRDE